MADALEPADAGYHRPEGMVRGPRTPLRAVRTWLARGILVFATLLYLEIARRMLLDPRATMQPFGIVLTQPVSITTVRAVMGAFFLGLSITAFRGLMLPAQTRIMLWVMVTFTACVVAGRLLGMALDGADAMNKGELSHEALGFGLYVAALIALPRERRDPHARPMDITGGSR